MVRAGLFPASRYARVSCLIIGIDLLLFALKRILELAGNSYGQFLNFWINFLGLTSLVLLLSLAYRWLKSRVLWRLRNRLIVTYVFIGVIPAILLLTMALGTLYLFAGQFANFVVIAELNSRLRSLGVMNSEIAHDFASRLERGASLSPEMLQSLIQQDKWRISARYTFAALSG